MKGYQPKNAINKIPPTSGTRVKPGRDYHSVEAVVRNDPPTEKEILYADFVNWALMKRMTPDQFRYIYIRYYDEYIGGL